MLNCLTCSFCGRAELPADTITCPGCGHRADMPWGRCDCPACRAGAIPPCPPGSERPPLPPPPPIGTPRPYSRGHEDEPGRIPWYIIEEDR